VRAVLVLVLLTSLAHARSEKTLAYTRDQAWPAAVRFLRVDAHVKIIEKDADAGYVLFELVDAKKTYRGSLELVTIEKDGQPVIRFVVSVEDRPTWMEVELLNRLEQKLHAELGPPTSPPPKKPPPAKDPAKDKDAPKKDAPKPDDGPPISETP
jgi:hypothetical protein